MELLILPVVGLTSAIAGVIGVKRCGLSLSGLASAAALMLECIAAGMMFTLGNLVLAVAVVLGLRMLAGWFVSMYLLDDVAWLLLPLLQGITWSLWRQRARERGRSRVTSP